MAKPAHEPTEESRELVAALVAAGIPVEAIGQIIKLSPRTLYRHYRPQLDEGKAVANGRVAQTLYRMALNGRNVAATIFWLKTRAGWKETQNINLAARLEELPEAALDEQLDPRD